MEGEGEVKGGADVEFAKVESKVWKEERGNEESGKRKEATRSLERGDEQKALTRVAGRPPPCQPYISSSRYYSKYPHILLDAGHQTIFLYTAGPKGRSPNIEKIKIPLNAGSSPLL